jgi:hypothetical protein
MQVVRVSPIAAHFLLRSRLEQSLILGAAAVFALPWFALGAVGLLVGGTGGHAGMVLGAMLLPAAVCGWLGLKLGTWAANIVALLRHRRAQGGA